MSRSAYQDEKVIFTQISSFTSFSSINITKKGEFNILWLILSSTWMLLTLFSFFGDVDGAQNIS